MGEVTLRLTKSQAILVAFLAGQFYRYMMREGVTDISVSLGEVGDLVDQLTEAVGVAGEDEA